MKPKTPPPRILPLPSAIRLTEKVSGTLAAGSGAGPPSRSAFAQTIATRRVAGTTTLQRVPATTTPSERPAQTPSTVPRIRNAADRNLATRGSAASLHGTAGAPRASTSSIGRRSALTVPLSSSGPTSAAATSSSRTTTGAAVQTGRPISANTAVPARAVPDAIRGGVASARLGTALTPSAPLRAPAVPAAGTSSTVASRQRSAVALTKVVAPAIPSTSRSTSTTSLRRLEGKPNGNVATAALRISVNRATPLPERKPIAASAVALRTSSSSASLRNAPVRAGAEPVSRVVVAGKKTLDTAPGRRVVGQNSNLLIAPKEKTSVLPIPARTSVSSRITSIEKQNGKSKAPLTRPTRDTVHATRSVSSARQPESNPLVPPADSPAEATAEESTGIQDEQHTADKSAGNDTSSSSNGVSVTQVSEPASVPLEQTPPRTLRPLKLVEKRHSLSPKPNGYAAPLASIYSPSEDLAFQQEDNLSKRKVSSGSQRDGSKDASTSTASPKPGRYGLGLGITLPTQSLSRSHDAAVGSPVTGASPNLKYHPASAFDPPPRIPSISVTDSARAEEEEDDCAPHDKSKGVSLAIGIPCVIYVTPSSVEPSPSAGPSASSRTCLKAVCRYIGQVSGRSGEWIGVEINLASLSRLRHDISQDPEETLAANGLHDGSWDGIRYYKIHQSVPKSPAITQGSFSRPLSPFGSPYETVRDVSGRFRPMASRGLASAPTAFDTRSFASRLRGSSMTSSRGASLTQDGAWDGSMTFVSNPETSWVSGGNDPAGSRKCGLWIRPSDVVLVPGAHD